MSGGSYNYLFADDTDIGPDIGEMLADIRQTEEFDGKTQIIIMFSQLSDLQKRYKIGFKLLNEFMHDFEWYQSSDYGFDEVKKSANKLLENIAGKNKKAYARFIAGG
jgi:hypothetical protein